MATTHRYLLVFAALLVLLAATVGSHFLPLDRLRLPLALFFAATKTALVMVWFMHLDESSPLVRLFALVGLLWVAILITLTMADYLTRAGEMV